MLEINDVVAFACIVLYCVVVGRVRSGIMSIVLFLANILLHMHPISPT